MQTVLTTQISKETTATLSIGSPIVSISKDSAGELDYTFTADPADTGIPDNATYTWYVDNNNIGTGLSVSHKFDSANKDYKVKLVVSSPDPEDDIEVTNTVTSGTTPPTVVENSVSGKSVTSYSKYCRYRASSRYSIYMECEWGEYLKYWINSNFSVIKL